MNRQPKNASAARLHFAILFKAALAKNGWSQRAFATKMQSALASERKMSPATISQWCNAKVIPKTKEVLELAIAIVCRNKPGCEAEKQQLRTAYDAVCQETKQSSEETRRSVARLTTFLIPLSSSAAQLCGPSRT
jgi:transcriptional regulator with XRE-family HTH domain